MSRIQIICIFLWVKAASNQSAGNRFSVIFYPTQEELKNSDHSNVKHSMPGLGQVWLLQTQEWSRHRILRESWVWRERAPILVLVGIKYLPIDRCIRFRLRSDSFYPGALRQASQRSWCLYNVYQISLVLYYFFLYKKNMQTEKNQQFQNSLE